MHLILALRSFTSIALHIPVKHNFVHDYCMLINKWWLFVRTGPRHRGKRLFSQKQDSTVTQWYFFLLFTVSKHLFLSLFQAGPSRQVDDTIIIELQQRIRDLQGKLDSVGSYEVHVEDFYQIKSMATCMCSINFLKIILTTVIMIMKKEAMILELNSPNKWCKMPGIIYELEK